MAPETRKVTEGLLSCAEVAALLQQYLDDESDEVTAGRCRGPYLDDCERCGVDADAYRDITAALARRRRLPDVPVHRLRQFGDRIAAGDLPDQ